MQDNAHWYKQLQDTHPYLLETHTQASQNNEATSYKAVACFPWNYESLRTLWNGEMTDDPEKLERWNSTIDKWSGTVVAGGERTLRVLATYPNEEPRFLLQINVPDNKADIQCVAWSMSANSDGFFPLVAFSANRIIYILDIERGLWHGVLRGHGGNINFLAVHPVDPCYMISASNDYSCRVYDLTKRVDGADANANPSWPGSSKPALAGPAFGLRSNEPEGFGHGRCVAILAGGPSGGHRAPVTSVAFHSVFPLIATCGRDHAVKIWRIPDLNEEAIIREDKPLFSSTHVHSSPVVSITWANAGDILISSSDDIIIRDPESRGLQKLPGTLVLWRWLSLDRFFPPGRTKWPRNLCGIAADFEESSSFRVIAKYKLPPPIGRSVPCYHHSETAYPLIAIPSREALRLSSVEHFTPVRPPPFPFDSQSDEGTERPYINNDFEGDLVTILPCCDIELRRLADGTQLDVPDLVKLNACAFGEDGRVLVGVSDGQGMWIWRLRPDAQTQDMAD